MKKQKVFNDFETLATYNFVGNKAKNHTAKNKNFKNNLQEETNSKTDGNSPALFPNFSIVSPNSLDEINKIILSLKNLEPIVVDLTYKKEVLTQKVLNYLNGAVFALGGSINKLTNNIYIILPKGANINAR